MPTLTEENYLKAIYRLDINTGNKNINTNAIAEELHTKAASVTDMLKKLSDKELINYIKYRGVSLTDKGKKLAVQVIRRHRLWEYFLVEKLNFSWDEVHEVAEELEHINSVLLTDKLDDYLGNPTYDPHGDPIPDKKGNITQRLGKALIDLEQNEIGRIVGVKDSSTEFLSYLNDIQAELGASIKVLKKIPFDNSLLIELNKNSLNISYQVAKNIYITN